SCTKQNGDNYEYDRVVLLYLAANNNLSSYASNNIESIKKGYLPSEEDKKILLVYSHISGALPKLVRIYKDREGIIREDVVSNYQEQNSADPLVLKEVLDKIKVIFPSGEYGLILWSHATGWLPGGYYDSPSAPGTFFPDPYKDIVKSFGEDNGREMEITELAEAIGYPLSFIIFDCCFMGGIETAYQLRNKCEYILASPTEILATGFPYDMIMAPLFGKSADLTGTGNLFFDFYNSKSGIYRSATLALYKTDKLENLAGISKRIFSNNRAEISAVELSAVQEYFRLGKHWFYDISDFMRQVASTNEYNEFVTALNQVVIKKWTTESFIDIKIESYSGMSIYVPVPSNAYLSGFYKNYSWNQVCQMIQ
ncbi:MAG: clostripain-related cysteine peptidase, partial [Bacteroidales bacterium]|nr:clostripain-related cysteine peptidase [Bacteroidales bacterium]